MEPAVQQTGGGVLASLTKKSARFAEDTPNDDRRNPDDLEGGMSLPGLDQAQNPAQGAWPPTVPMVEVPGSAAQQHERPQIGGGSSIGRSYACDVALLVCGMRPNVSLWGRESWDWGLASHRKEDWFAESPTKHPRELNTFWTTPTHRVPAIRHLWGEAQYELHPGSQELFLDLIFVGVAYRIGSVLKVAFYLCTPVEEFSLPSDPLPDEKHACVGLPIGLVHALAPFACMYLMWQIETSFRAKFYGCECCLTK